MDIRLIFSDIAVTITVDNALDAVKQARRATVPSREDSAQAWAIEHYILGGEQP